MHRLVYASISVKVKRPPPKIVRARTYKEFNKDNFYKDFQNAPWSVGSIFHDPDDCYWAWSKIFNEVCDIHAPFREIKIRKHSLPWVTSQIRHLMNRRYKTLLCARKRNCNILWSEYRSLRNQITSEVRRAKSKYFKDQFDKVKDCRSYWKLIKKGTCSQSTQPILGTRR